MEKEKKSSLDKKMHVYIVCPRLCHGGAERVAVLLAHGFIKEGHSVTFFSNLYEEVTYKIDTQVHLINLFGRSTNKFFKWISAIGVLRKSMVKEKPDVVIGIMPLCSLIARFSVVGLRIPVIASEHNAFERPKDYPMPFWLKIYKFYVCKLFFPAVTVLTNADKELFGLDSKKVYVMPNPLAMKPLKDVPRKERIILAAGRIDNWQVKGFDVLIKAWGLLQRRERREECDNLSEWRLQIAGVWRDPKTKEYLDNLAREYGVMDKIDYLGFVNNMEQVYQNASVFVLSSRYEGFGLVLIEAMSQGCACVACDFRGRQREIITSKKEGLVCEVDNVESLANCIFEMICNTHYREYAQRNAIERSHFYDEETIIMRWLNLFDKVLV